MLKHAIQSDMELDNQRSVMSLLSRQLALSMTAKLVIAS